MDCREVKNKISEYIDGRLGEDETLRVKEHLASCAGCMETYESMTRLIGFMNNMEPVEEPDTMLSDVKARLEKRTPLADLARRLFSPPRIKIPLELAGAALVAVLVMRMAGVGGGPAVDIVPDPAEVATQEAPAALSRPLSGQPADQTAAGVKPVKLKEGLGAGDRALAVRGGRSGELSIELDDMAEAPTPAGPPAEVRDLSPAARDEAVNEIKPDKGSLKKGGRRQRILQDEEEAIPDVIQPQTTATEAITFNEKIDEAAPLENKEKPAQVADTDQENAQLIPEITVKVAVKETRVEYMRVRGAVESTRREEPCVTVINSVGGKIIDVEGGDEDDNQITGMLVEIPADSLDVLLARLKTLGEVEAGAVTSPAAPKRYGRMLLKIRLR